MLELASLISNTARHAADRDAVRFEDRRYSYGMFAARVARAANALRSLGVAKGARVATVTANCIEQLEIYWACPTIGAVLVPLSPLLRESGLAALLADSGPRYVLTTEGLAPLVRAARNRAGLDLSLQIMITGADGGTDESYEALLARSSDTVDPETCHANDVFNIMYSSGTTGTPKGIVHTHGVRAMYALLFGAALGIEPSSVVVQSGSLVFNGAFTTLLPLLLNAGRYLLMRQFDPKECLELIERERGTHIGLVPSQIIALFDDPSFDSARLACLQSIMSVGAPLLKEYKDRLNEQLPGRLCEIYGLTEGFATFLDRRDAVRKAGSVGVPLPFSQMRIVREDNSRCVIGEIGEIVGRGPLLMSGYHNRPDLTAQTIRDGWLYSGDMGYVDEEGFLYLVDRKKDMIDSGGIKVYPKDVEEIGARHPAVREIAVFGIPDPQWGETPVAAVLIHATHSVTADALREWINQRVAAKYQRLAKVEILSDFPRNEAGKTLKRQLREPYWEKVGRRI